MDPRFKAGDTAIDVRNGHELFILSDAEWDEQMEEWTYVVRYRTGPNSGENSAPRGVVDDWLESPGVNESLRRFISMII